MRTVVRASLGLAAGIWVTVAVLVVTDATAYAQAMPKREVQRLMREADSAMGSARRLLGDNKVKKAGERLTEASKAFRKILKSDSSHRGAALGLSQVYYLRRAYEKGVELMRPLAEAKPDDMAYAHQLGLHLYRNGQRDEAVTLLEKVADNPDRFDAMWLLATHFYRTADWKKGLPHLERYTKVRAKDVRAMGLLGTYYLKLSRFKEAVASFDKFLKKFKGNVAARVNRANALFRMKDYDAAARAYQALLKELPDRARLIYNLAAIHIRRDNCDKAVPLLDRFLKLQKRHPTGLYFKADCEFKLGRYKEARETFLVAGQVAKSNPWVHFGLSQIEHKLGNPQEALTHAKKAAEVGPNEWEIANWVGTLLRRAGQPAEALTWHDKALEKKPDAAPIHVERGRDLWALKRLDDSGGAFARAVELDAKLAPATLGLATVRTAQGVEASKAGQADLARTRLGEAIKTLPSYDLARVNLALLELHAGQTSAADKAIAGVKNPTADTAAVIGMVRLLQGKLDKADAAVKKALSGGSQLKGLVFTAAGHLAARKGAWADAVRNLDSAIKIQPSDSLRRARTLAGLNLGLERLSKGDGGAARTILQKVDKNRGMLKDAGDRTRLEIALSASAVIAKPTSEKAASKLGKLVASRKLKGPKWAKARDVGNAYVAFSLLKRKRYDAVLKQLKRVKDPLGGVVKRMQMASFDAKARKSFNGKKYKAAAKLWKEVKDPSPAIKVNLGAALYASGNSAAKSYWGGKGPPEALYNRAIAADREGRYKEAFSLFKKYVARGGSKAKRAKQRLKAKRRVFGWK